MKKIKNFIKNLIRKFGWRLEKIRKNSFYNLEKPNLELINALINCKGIIHVGAHRGEEAPVYEWFGKKYYGLRQIHIFLKILKIIFINTNTKKKAYKSLTSRREKNKCKI